MILDGGPCLVGVESTVVSFTDETPVLLRPGGLSLEEIEAVIGPVRTSPSQGGAPQAPGQLDRHYAPRTPLKLETQLPGLTQAKQRLGLLTLNPPDDFSRFQAVEILSSKGDLREAAANLFAAMRRLDDLNLDQIIALEVPSRGLGLAINDRLKRASHS